MLHLHPPIGGHGHELFQLILLGSGATACVAMSITRTRSRVATTVLMAAIPPGQKDRPRTQQPRHVASPHTLIHIVALHSVEVQRNLGADSLAFRLFCASKPEAAFGLAPLYTMGHARLETRRATTGWHGRGNGRESGHLCCHPPLRQRHLSIVWDRLHLGTRRLPPVVAGLAGSRITGDDQINGD
jgi:hypothetical protein